MKLRGTAAGDAGLDLHLPRMAVLLTSRGGVGGCPIPVQSLLAYNDHMGRHRIERIMTTTTIKVILTEDGRWAVEAADAEGGRIYCISRATAIATGVQRALRQDGILLIHGVEGELTELELVGHDARHAV